MKSTYDLFARLHTGYFEQGDIDDLQNFPPEGCSFENLRISDNTTQMILFTFTCEIPDGTNDEIREVCQIAGDVLYRLGYELWEVNLQELL